MFNEIDLNAVEDTMKNPKKKEPVVVEVKEEIVNKPAKAKVIGGSLNVRAYPNGEIVGKLENGDVVDIASMEDREWFKINSGSMQGYVMSKFLVVE